MSALLSPTPVFKAFDNNGAPLAFGLLTSFAAGTTTAQPTYVDSTLTTQNTNPIVLNSRGECSLWLNPGLSYKLQLTDSLGNSIWTVDNILGSSTILFNDGSAATPAIAFAADPNTGIYRPGSDTIGFTTGGSETLQIAGGPSSSTIESLNAPAGQTVSMTLNGNGVSDFSGGYLQQNASGNFRVKNGNATGSLTLGAGNLDTMTFTSAGVVSVNGFNITPTSGTFTVGITGLTTSPTGTATWQLVNGYVDLYIPGVSLSGTSNATTCTLTGLPASLQPPTATYTFPVFLVDAGTGTIGSVNISGSGTMNLTKGTNPTASATFTASGTKSIFTISVRYLLI